MQCRCGKPRLVVIPSFRHLAIAFTGPILEQDIRNIGLTSIALALLQRFQVTTATAR